MLVKAIFKVNFQFNNPRSYEQAVKTYNHKLENLYKGEVCIKPEMMFDDVTMSVSVPNHVVTTLEKTIKNTAYILDDVAKFAASGKAFCWIVNEGKASFSYMVEPTEEKTIIQNFLKGRQLAREAGKEQEAINVLTDATSKFDRHWTAFERRGYVYGLVGEFDKAMTDFNTSITVNPNQADAYFSRARVNMMQKKYDLAIIDFDSAWKNANPQMPVYWSARRVKAECCILLGDFAGAARELGFFTKQNFAADNPNFPWRKAAWLNFSYALHKNKAEKDAVEAFKKAYQIKDNLEPVMNAEMMSFCDAMSAKCGLVKIVKKNDDVLEIA